jgi:signal transduction histidine kinase
MTRETLITVPKPARKPRLSLRAQVSFSIAALAFLPNFLLLSYFWVTSLNQTPLERVRTLWPMVFMALVGLLTAIFVGLFLARNLLRSLTQLERDVRELASQGDVALEFDPNDPAEVMNLRESFSDLLQNLSLEQNRRGAFMATLMHDLKTPIIATNHLLSTFKEVDIPFSERKEVISHILEENTRLLALVQQMVDAHKFERDGVSLNIVGVDLAELASKVLERTRRKTIGDLKLELSGEGEGDADPVALERALSNLLENALRYAHTRIRITIWDNALRVFDDGPGLSKPLRELAQPFNAQPVHIAGKQYTAGTGGLGLYIVRRIAEAHGGTLEHEETQIGTALIIRLK